jgi:hypothetical protein
MKYNQENGRVTLSPVEMTAARYWKDREIKTCDEPHEFGSASTKGLKSLLGSLAIDTSQRQSTSALREIYQTIDELKKDFEQIPD